MGGRLGAARAVGLAGRFGAARVVALGGRVGAAREVGLGGRGWRWVGGGHGAAILCACGCRGFSFGHVGAAKDDGAIGYGLVLRVWLQRVSFWACRAAKGDGANGYGLVGLEERSRLASGYGQEGWRSRNKGTGGWLEGRRSRNKGTGGWREGWRSQNKGTGDWRGPEWVEVGVGLVAASVMGRRPLLAAEAGCGVASRED